MPNYVDTMVLGNGHSILMSHVPNHHEEISNRFFSEAKPNKDSIDQFGLFGSGTNYNTFYQDVDPEDLHPNDEEFIEPMFRLLSACIVSKNYMPTEFPKNVLKDSMNLLVGQTVNCDHETDVANAIGSVKSVSWQESYTVDGVTIPAGINGVLKIDGKSNPRIARGINMDPPSIHSNSVTVQFEWKPSHRFEKEWEFYDKLGTIAEDGTMVRRIATRIISYKETSLVSHGADPFAQLIKDNKINNPAYAGSVYYSFSEAPIKKEDLPKKLSFFEFKGAHEVDIMYNTSKFINENNNTNPKDKPIMNELEKFLESLFGDGMLTLQEGATISQEMVLSQIRTIVSENSSLSEAKTNAEDNINKLNDEINTLKETIESNKLMVTIGTNHLTEVRNNAISSYKKLVGEDKVDENIISLLESNTTSIETLISLTKTYDLQLEEKFPLVCKECGSKNVSRASSVTKDDESTEETKNSEDLNSTIKNIADSKLK